MGDVGTITVCGGDSGCCRSSFLRSVCMEAGEVGTLGYWPRGLRHDSDCDASQFGQSHLCPTYNPLSSFGLGDLTRCARDKYRHAIVVEMAAAQTITYPVDRRAHPDTCLGCFCSGD